MSSTIKNNILNITSIDVSNETDLTKLKEWHGLLSQKINEIKTRIESAKIDLEKSNTPENKSIYVRTCDAKSHNQLFLKLIEDRLYSIRKKNKNGVSKYIQNLINFKEIAKQLLDDDVYEEINVKSKLKTEENDINLK